MCETHQHGAEGRVQRPRRAGREHGLQPSPRPSGVTRSSRDKLVLRGEQTTWQSVLLQRSVCSPPEISLFSSPPEISLFSSRDQSVLLQRSVCSPPEIKLSLFSSPPELSGNRSNGNRRRGDVEILRNEARLGNKEVFTHRGREE
ncbi:hypothetical protein EYF80_024263 [Liparis tanakae]|uniref:Uncharacterized protein n=1 Tax=Liparis tanakae TaxID=230148 RepID=A0A4Z2HKK5_9TELE|nr:hypothetical protein EYF80_024263 [Liparis tanakae]